MEIDLNKYDAIRIYVKYWVKNYPERDILNSIDLIAVTNHCPLIVVAHFFGETVGYTDEIKKLINGLIKFYQYDVNGV